MSKSKLINGFSKLTKGEKITWLEQSSSINGEVFNYFTLPDENKQKIIDGFSENTISNYILPYGIAPNFLIDGDMYAVPMVIEESSVVAAASAAAKYWMDRGGFKTTIVGTTKVGQVHFLWYGDNNVLKNHFTDLKQVLIDKASHLTTNMESRGGGIKDIDLIDFTSDEKGLYQLRAYFETCDSMGANFINTILECFASTLKEYIYSSPNIPDSDREIDVIMSILSNHTPECVVRVEVSCPIDKLGTPTHSVIAPELAEKFKTAVKIAKIDPYRATTHNKGIYNGIDAVVLATGNDFRAIEAAGHTYAARSGQYRSLSDCEIVDGQFRFWLEVPLAVGTVGGLTSLHPLAAKSLEILGNPSAQQLMGIIATVGLAQNFAAVRSLVTTGIQHGHMKMHLQNILNSLSANDDEAAKVQEFFSDKTVSYSGVRDFLEELR